MTRRVPLRPLTHARGGADIRYIRELLGHDDLSTTQIYTQVSIRRLKAVHALTHPNAKIDRPKAAGATNAGSEAGVANTPSLVAVEPPLGAADLMATLAEEAEED
jgi:hypothetical protein